MSIFKTVSGIAKKATGSVSDFRKVLDLKPSLSGLMLPPQVSMGLKAANLIGGAFGVDIPTEDEIKAYAQGKLDKALGGVFRDANKVLGDVEGKLTSVNGKLVKLSSTKFEGKTDVEILQSIDWLL